MRPGDCALDTLLNPAVTMASVMRLDVYYS